MKLQRGNAHSETLGLIVSCDIVVTKQNLHNGIIIKQIKFPIVNCLIVQKFNKFIKGNSEINQQGLDSRFKSTKQMTCNANVMGQLKGMINVMGGMHGERDKQ